MASSNDTKALGSFPFLSLPPELQQLVLELYFEEPWTMSLVHDTISKRHYHTIQPDITAPFLVSKDFGKVAKHMFSLSCKDSARGTYRLYQGFCNGRRCYLPKIPSQFCKQIGTIVSDHFELIKEMHPRHVFSNLRALTMDSVPFDLCSYFLGTSDLLSSMVSQAAVSLNIIDLFNGDLDQQIQEKILSNLEAQLGEWPSQTPLSVSAAGPRKDVIKGIVLSCRVSTCLTTTEMVCQSTVSHPHHGSSVVEHDLEITQGECKILNRGIRRYNIRGCYACGTESLYIFPSTNHYGIDEFLEALRKVVP